METPGISRPRLEIFEMGRCFRKLSKFYLNGKISNPRNRGLHDLDFEEDRTTCSFSKYHLHGDISTAINTIAESKFLKNLEIFDLGKVVPNFFVLRVKKLRMKYDLHGHISLNLIFGGTTCSFLSFKNGKNTVFLRLEMCPTRTHFEENLASFNSLKTTRDGVKSSYCEHSRI